MEQTHSHNLQLLLFVDDRPNNLELAKTIKEFLAQETNSDLQVINVSSQPYLAEHFKVVMTPTLIKISPLPRQTLAGKTLFPQLIDTWKQWQRQSTLSNDLPSNSSSSLPYATELIRVADEMFWLNQSKANLEAQLQFKDRIISMLAHDLRSPLTAVSLALETIEISGTRLSSEYALQLFKNARGQTKIADAMITDILEASTGKTSELHINPQKIQISDLCRSVVDDLTLLSQIKTKNQKLTVDIPTDLPRVFADCGRVRQVLTNLMDNAIKYTAIGGEISISVQHRTAQKIQISVTDNGEGIPVEERDRIFEDHFRLPRDDHKEGYGIGLSVCKRIIRAHYGQIWVDAAGKQGSCFHFTLPVY